MRILDSRSASTIRDSYIAHAEIHRNKFFGLFKKTLADGVDVFVAKRGEFLQLGLLFGRQARRHLDLDAHVQIAMAVALQVFHALALDAERRMRLRAGGDFDDRPAIERRHFNFRAERGLNKTHRHLAKQIVAVALENFMRLEVQHHVKVARRPAAKPGLAVAG